MIVPPPSTNEDRRRIALFHYYRQLSLGDREDARLLVLPTTLPEHRTDAFRCIHLLNRLLRSKNDPRSTARSKQIAELAVVPFLQRWLPSRNRERGFTLRFADLGAGSGDVLRRIGEYLRDNSPELIARRCLDWTLVDLAFSRQGRHFWNRRLFPWLSAYRCRRCDYRTWVAQQPTMEKASYDLILLCRLLNNQSCFSIRSAADWPQVQRLGGEWLTEAGWREEEYLPDLCLCTEAWHPERLIASNGSLRLPDGSRALRQLSLSDYFRGIHVLLNPERSIAPGREEVFFAARRFDSTALLMPDGSSMLQRLCRLARMVIIEDVDLHGRALREHLEEHHAEELAASDVTLRNRMRSASLLCVALRLYADMLPGQRIW